jgi:GT2 family glycosyltransferase
MKSPEVAIVIVHWNRRNLLEQFLPSVCDTDYENYKIYVVDNASTDDSVEFLRTHFPDITIIQLEENHGYAGGYNLALKFIKADYYVLLNNDIEVPRHWLKPVIAAMEADKSIAACQPKMLDYLHKDRFEYAGACGGYLDKFGYAFCRGRIFDTLETDTGQYNSEAEIFWATGACLFIRAKCFHEVKGFDEHFFAHMEEIDLCWRLQLLGYKIKVIPQSHVYHVGGGTLDKMSAQKTYLNFRNNLIMLTKNEPVSRLLWLIPVRSFLDLLSSLFFIIHGHFSHSAAVHRAHSHYFFKWRKWWKLRNPSTNYRMRLNGIYNNSIVFRYFLQKHSTFNQLTNR